VAPFLGAIASAVIYAVYAGGTIFGVTMPIGPIKPQPKAKPASTKKTKKKE
jgi:hypothetical protein